MSIATTTNVSYLDEIMPDHSDGKIRSGGFKLEEWVDKAASEFNYGVSGVVQRPRKVETRAVVNSPDIVINKVDKSILSGGPSKRYDFAQYLIRKAETDLMKSFVVVKPTKLARRPKTGTYISRAK